MPACKICGTPCADKREVYFICPNCGCWQQDPQPPKCYQDPAEPMVMSERDKGINLSLAQWLVDHVMQGKPGRTLDIGCGWPYLAHCLMLLGCDAGAIDGEPIPSPDLCLAGVRCDFEHQYCDGPGDFRLITMIHSFEHVYDPLAVLRKLRGIIAEDGHLFIRLPDHDVSGYERDLTEHHWLIHPFFHCFESILEALKQTGTFAAVETSPMEGAGQRDLVLRPI